MATEPLTIKVDPTGDLGRALATADTRPAVLDSNGVRSTLQPEDGFARSDPAAVLAGLCRSRGALKGVDLNQLLSDLAEQREQDAPG